MSKKNIEKLKFYASAKRAGAKKYSLYENGDFVNYWAGTLRGNLVTMDAKVKHKARQDALDDARKFRESCRKELTND